MARISTLIRFLICSAVSVGMCLTLMVIEMKLTSFRRYTTKFTFDYNSSENSRKFADVSISSTSFKPLKYGIYSNLQIKDTDSNLKRESQTASYSRVDISFPNASSRWSNGVQLEQEDSQFPSYEETSDKIVFMQRQDSDQFLPNLYKEELMQSVEIVIGQNKILHTKYTHLQPNQQPGGNGTGLAVITKRLPDEELKNFNEGWEKNAYNQYVSDKISVHRDLPDIRYEGCKREFPRDLPDTSVIICFHNEGWSALLRSVHSVLDRSPSHLIKEIILVDDFSSEEHLKQPLDDYISNLQKVKIIRTKKREGLIRARLVGESAATASVLTFLDSHIECYPGWLEPLLEAIANNHSSVVWPHINIIDDTSFALVHDQAHLIGIFSITNLQFGWEELPPDETKRRENIWDSIRTPVMAGGLFSINKAYFQYLGKYDTGMEIWGGENIEISLRAWMCGGNIQLLPCSHVGHIFRKRTPYKLTETEEWSVKVINRNKIRYADVWLDDYKHAFYERLNYIIGEYGDLTERRELKERLKCHDFEWYIRNVYPSIRLPEKSLYSGEVRWTDDNLCLVAETQWYGALTVQVNSCHGQGMNQFWALTENGHIYAGWESTDCFNYIKQVQQFKLEPCNPSSQRWRYENSKIILSDTGECLQIVPNKLEIIMTECVYGSSQTFNWRRD